MRRRTRTITFGLLLSTVWMLTTSPLVCAQEKRADDKITQGTVQLRPDDVTKIVAFRGSRSGNLKQEVNNAIYGFDTPQDTITWTVNAPKEDDYAVSLLYSMKTQTNIEVRCGESVLLVPSILCTWENRPFFWRQELPGTLHLKAGENQITLRLPDAQTPVASKDGGNRGRDRFGYGITEAFHLWSIELGTPAARQGQVARAQDIRGDASWMIEGKYGIFVHWSSLSHGFTGSEPRASWFQKSVRLFDVKVFADAIQRTGAAWIVFTATHKGFYWPAPNAALDRILPGRTAQRDLLGEIINELDKRGIHTLFYLHTAYNGGMSSHD